MSPPAAERFCPIFYVAQVLRGGDPNAKLSWPCKALKPAYNAAIKVRDSIRNGNGGNNNNTPAAAAGSSPNANATAAGFLPNANNVESSSSIYCQTTLAWQFAPAAMYGCTRAVLRTCRRRDRQQLQSQNWIVRSHTRHG